MPEILTYLALEQTKVNFRTKYLYCNNQQKIIFQISLIFFKYIESGQLEYFPCKKKIFCDHFLFI